MLVNNRQSKIPCTVKVITPLHATSNAKTILPTKRLNLNINVKIRTSSVWRILPTATLNMELTVLVSALIAMNVLSSNTRGVIMRNVFS